MVTKPTEVRQRSSCDSTGPASGACRPCGRYVPAAALVLAGLSVVSIGWMLLACVGLAVALLVGGVLLIPQPTVRFLVWSLSKLFYRVEVYGQENVPAEGAALLAANHVSWLDGVLLMLISRRPVRMMVYEGNFRNRTMQRMARIWGAIMVNPGPKMILRALKTAHEALEHGEVVGLFPEGGVTRSGVMQGFRPGMMKILQGTRARSCPSTSTGSGAVSLATNGASCSGRSHAACPIRFTSTLANRSRKSTTHNRYGKRCRNWEQWL